MSRSKCKLSTSRRMEVASGLTIKGHIQLFSWLWRAQIIHSSTSTWEVSVGKAMVVLRKTVLWVAVSVMESWLCRPQESHRCVPRSCRTYLWQTLHSQCQKTYCDHIPDTHHLALPNKNIYSTTGCPELIELSRMPSAYLQPSGKYFGDPSRLNHNK
ncbi:hypothetical protein RvY_10274-2 [Ramazzottius varieornatus]|uniref:Uncharacterized protein n=2 Tax=Ramazzottius varieornatus TaxID=947166 RepID=A0A1D1VK00_RAMVA|nr:hypothetical protein RvY_10274-2 [Ramazzottius varieornatus]